MIWGVLLSVCSILAIVFWSSHLGKATAKTGAGLVSGLILGTIIGGACTIGTAQLAFLYGMSAWWYCLGAGLACLVLAFGFSNAIRKENGRTLLGIVGKEYGRRVGLYASFLNSFVTFINILSQLIAATSVIAVIAPEMSLVSALFLSMFFMAAYVVVGGSKGAGMAGLVKLVLIYISMVVCGYLVLQMSGGLGAVIDGAQTLTQTTGINYLSFFGRGVGVDLGACASLIVGVTTTQIYAQALTNAKDDRSARLGALVSSIMVAAIGAGGVLVGLYMRMHFPQIPAKTALTQFVLNYIPGTLGGIVLGTLLITVVACGAGLTLGIATIINKDIIQAYTKRFSDVRRQLVLQKVLIVLVLFVATIFCILLENDVILSYAYLSMALRGTVVLAPLCCALWLKGQIKGYYALGCVFLGPISVVLLKSIGFTAFDPHFVGLGLTFVLMGVGFVRNRQKQ